MSNYCLCVLYLCNQKHIMCRCFGACCDSALLAAISSTVLLAHQVTFKVVGIHVNKIHDFCKQLNFSRLGYLCRQCFALRFVFLLIGVSLSEPHTHEMASRTIYLCTSTVKFFLNFRECRDDSLVKKVWGQG